MQKIKDNVDLKELGKFGFRKDESKKYMINDNIDVIDDLIQAGLVEKVEE